MSETPREGAPMVTDDPKKATDVFAAEWSEVRRRRRFVRLREWRRSRDEDDDPIAPPDNLTGLALSGGGIRSATFNLGLVQGLGRHGVLTAFDYLSTVSGGGYFGGWWSGWLARDPLFDPADLLDPRRFAGELQNIRTRFAGYLYERFTDRGLEALRALSEGHMHEETLQHVVDELNRVLRGIPLYDDAHRLGVLMRTETQSLAMEDDPDAAQVNRMVLEDAFPDLLRRQSFIERGSFPPREGIEPERGKSYIYEPNQIGRGPTELRTKISDSAMSAGHDPVHHLRLFANYLTPRKGALSGDTWRAVAVFSRNLSLTWMILLPIFIAVMLVGQLYYIINPSTTDSFLHEKVGKVVPCTMITALGYLTNPDKADSVVRSHHDPHPHAVSDGEVLLVRFAALLWPLIPIAGWIVLIVVAWMICGQDGTALRQRFVPWIEIFAMTALVLCLLWIFKAETEPELEMVTANGFSMKEQIAWWGNWYAIIPWGAIGGILLAVGLRTGIGRHAPPERRGESEEIYRMQLDAWRKREDARRQWRKEVRRNRLVRIHSKLMIAGVLIAFVLLVAGFSHEAINFIFYSQTVESMVADWITEAGGWCALLLTIAGGIFTAVKASPSGGGDRKGESEASGLTQLIITVTPTLMVLLIALLAAWWSHGLLGNLVIGGTNMCAIRQHFLERSEPLHYATFLGVVLSFVFAWYEMKFRDGMRIASRSLIAICLLFAIPLLTMAGLSIYSRHLAPKGMISDELSTEFVGGILGPAHPSPHIFSLLLAMLVGTFICVRLFCRRPRLVDTSIPAGFIIGGDRAMLRDPISPLRVLAIIALTFIIVVIVGFWIVPVAFLSDSSLAVMREWLTTLAERNLTGYTVFGFWLLLIYLLVELFTGKGSNNRSLALLVSIFIALAVLLVMSYLPGQTFDSPLWAHPTEGSLIVLRVHAAFGLVATFLAWAIALGWTVDPNMLSIHAFYKARLTRAYMGASNYKRHQKQSEITEAVEGDDVPMWQLRNCHRGGPYHLVNTTLNLVGGRDLATAQRSAANFIMTQNYCGSVRTGYRQTDRYMNGRLTLGTAVSISGAAASPNMGSKTPTAALAMLMTMFNVKLGYWAPTPNRDSWASPQARLWPFYTLRELTSQTNDLSSYCYLTDGGHFENTGLYALVERGCRYIVLSDCGADPQPCFSDLGDAIRRCRIDFGIEFDLEILPVKVKSDDSGERYGTAHFVIGKLTYSEAHLQRLRGSHAPIGEADRTGYIIVVKPTLTGDESVDVRQYGFENSTFPQQSTGDQWYDEAQFESYRKLGERSIDSMLATVEETAKEAESAHDARISTAARDLIPILDRLRGGDALQPDEIPVFFEGIHAILTEQWRDDKK